MAAPPTTEPNGAGRTTVRAFRRKIRSCEMREQFIALASLSHHSRMILAQLSHDSRTTLIEMDRYTSSYVQMYVGAYARSRMILAQLSHDSRMSLAWLSHGELFSHSHGRIITWMDLTVVLPVSNTTDGGLQKRQPQSNMWAMKLNCLLMPTYMLICIGIGYILGSATKSVNNMSTVTGLIGKVETKSSVRVGVNNSATIASPQHANNWMQKNISKMQTEAQ